MAQGGWGLEESATCSWPWIASHARLLVTNEACECWLCPLCCLRALLGLPYANRHHRCGCSTLGPMRCITLTSQRRKCR